MEGWKFKDMIDYRPMIEQCWRFRVSLSINSIVRRAVMSTVALKSDEYRRNAEECWEAVNHAEDIETKAVFELTAEAWTMLAMQVEMLGASGPEAITAPALQLSTA
jgi:hypothetical protein